MGNPIDGKAAITSKTLGWNILSAIAAVGMIFGMDFGLDPATKGEVLASVNIIGNVIFRFLTTTGINRLI